jgi:hypothetical protein
VIHAGSSAETQRQIEGLRDSAERRLLNGSSVVLTPTTDGEPMICDDREADPRATEHHRTQRGGQRDRDRG